MSKYNLTDILNEVAGGRIGTLNISARDLVNKMEELEDKGVRVERFDGLSPDGKTYIEFHVHPIRKYDEDYSFSIYDYKFGFDPMSPEHADEEYPFSVGGRSSAFDSAETTLRGGDTGYQIDEAINEDEFDEARQSAIESSQEKAGIKEENVIKDLAQADEVIKIIKMMNPDVREDLLKRIARMGQKLNEGDLFSSEFDRGELKAIINDLNKGLILDMPTRRAYKFLVSLLDKQDKEEMGLNEEDKEPRDGVKSAAAKLGIKPSHVKQEQMYIDDEEFEMEMGRSKKDSLKKEMMIHIDQLIDGNIDMNDFMNVVEDIMAEVKSMKEVMGIDRKGRKKPDTDGSDATKFKKAAMSEDKMKIRDIRTALKQDAKGTDVEIDSYFTSLMKAGDEFDTMEDYVEDFQNYVADKSLQEHFKRFI